jgi:hypothetical protein
VAVSAIIVVGAWREIHHTLHHVPVGSGNVGYGHSQQLITFAAIFILLKAFANGGSSLTGLEAISNGVSLFKSPEGNNARRTTVIMATILGCMVLGISFFAKATHALPYSSGTPTVVSQIASVVFGHGTLGHIFYLFVQFSTMLILYTGANTPFSGFPFLMNFIAEDGFLPRQLTKRGHRLVFSNGIMVLTIAAAALIAAVGSNVSKLIAFYAIGVFTGFTMAGFGMAKRNWTLREAGWRIRFFINFLSGVVSLVVVIVFAIVKFTEGAWLIVLIFPIATIALIRLNRQYRNEQQALKINQSSSRATNISRHDVTVLVDAVDIATVGAIRYARSLNPHQLAAVHFVIDDLRADVIKDAWKHNPALADVSLEFIDCPDRRLANAAVDYAIRMTQASSIDLTLLLPRRSYSGLLGRISPNSLAWSQQLFPSMLKKLFLVALFINMKSIQLMLSSQLSDCHKRDDYKMNLLLLKLSVITPKISTRLHQRNGATVPMLRVMLQIFVRRRQMQHHTWILRFGMRPVELLCSSLGVGRSQGLKLVQHCAQREWSEKPMEIW